MIDGLREITTCEVCGDTRLNSVLDLGAHPMCDDLVRVGDERRCWETCSSRLRAPRSS
jgi:hypothetical protein